MSRWSGWTNSSSTATIDLYTTQTSASTCNTPLPTISAVFQRIYNYFETGTQQLYEPLRILGETAQNWVNTHELIHEPWNYIYVPGQDIEEILANQNEQLDDLQKKVFATQHLAPICEALELEGYKRVMDHLEKLLNDEPYRTFQLTEINKVNKILGLKECVWDAQAVRDRIGEIKGQHTPRMAWKSRGWKYIHKEAEKRATELFNEIFTAEEIMRLETDKKLVISRNGLTFELLPCGGINQLLPDGQKQGWCLVSKEYGLALKDVLVMKKLLLETAPEIVLQVANKRSAF